MVNENTNDSQIQYADNDTCRFCGKPLLIHCIMPALVEGREDIPMLHCDDPDCPLYTATGRDGESIWNTWEQHLRNKGFIK